MLLASFSNDKANAVPAKPGPVAMANNGDTITVCIHGDEHFHYRLTDDGYLLAENNGRMEFATVSESGILTPSGIKAVKPQRRTFATKQFLNGIDRSEQLRMLAQANRNVTRRNTVSRTAAHDGVGLFPGQHFPATGEQRAIVVLVEYADVEFTIGNPLDYFSRMLNEKGFSDFSGTGSAKDYFVENSGGRFIPTFDVFGPVKLSHNRSYYGGNDSRGNDIRPEMMVIEACQALDATVDFSQYDRDGDGFIDNVFIFYAGRGEASGGATETVWPHSWNIAQASSTPYIFDGVQLDYYACTNEWIGYMPDGIGTFVHEFSHVMGLPDLYHTTNPAGAFTPGEWSVLDHGPYNNNGRTPPLYSAFERYALGWGIPVTIDKPQNATLPPLQSGSYAIIPTNTGNEFFLLENRQQNSWDKYIPGHGMLIWHIDYNTAVWTANRVNNNRTHQYVDLEEADGSQNPYSRDGDAFPGAAGITSFTDNTTPSMLTWSGTPLNTPLTEITEDADGTIRFKVKGGREPLQPVCALEPTDIGSTSFTACWKPTKANAAAYRLDVYQKNNGKPTGLRSYNVADASTFTVDGLQPDSRYYYTVSVTDALEISTPSDEIEVTTAANTGILAPQSHIVPFWHVTGQTLEISIPENATCTIYDIAGRIVGRLSSSGSLTLPSKGVYIISSPGIGTAIIRL